MAQLKRVYFDNTIFVDVVKTDLGKELAADRAADVGQARDAISLPAKYRQIGFGGDLGQ